jgi:hypothetical protein
MKFTVTTRDVDGGTRRTYTTREGARKRFESMVGYSVDNAIAEQFYARAEAGQALPTWEEVKGLRAVSMFGTVVSFRAEDTQ